MKNRKKRPASVLTSSRVARASGSITTKNEGVNGTYSEHTGSVTTPRGVVRVWASRYDNPHMGKRFSSTSLLFVHGGREWHRFYRNRFYSARGLVTLAARFAEEVVSGKVNP